MKPRFALGIALLVVSIPLLSVGGIVVKRAIDQDDRAARQAAATDEQCRKRLETIGKVKNAGGTLTVVVDPVSDPRKALMDATLAQALCPQRALTELCLGDACSPDGKSIVLQFSLQRRPG